MVRASDHRLSDADARAAEILASLPSPLWGPLLRAVRRAVGHLDRADLPPALRPFATWKPDRLAADRPRRAVGEALAVDSRLRAAVGQQLEDQDAFADAEAADPLRLIAEHGAAMAAAALAARGRWDGLAAVAAEGAARLAARRHSAAQAAERRQAAAAAADQRRLGTEVAALREERDVLRRRLTETETRLRVAEDRTRAMERDLERASADASAVRKQHDGQRRRAQERIGRLQRRLLEHNRVPGVDVARVMHVAEGLESLARQLRAALGTAAEPPDRGPSPAPPRPAASPPQQHQPATAPRQPSDGVAVPGRPCRLPSGLAPDDPRAVTALLQVPELEVIVDGYNVTKDLEGRPQAGLPEQRQWLLRLAAGVVARYAHRVTIVFDGTEDVAAPMPKPRGVFALFTRGQETADERILELVGHIDPPAPILVVSSDRAVRAGSEAAAANVTTAAAFLQAIR